MDGTRVKIQHYVPRFYLRHFADGERMFVYDKWKDKSFPSNIKNLASETAFYDSKEVDVLAGKSQFCEKWLSGLEQIAAPFFKTLLSEIDQKRGSFYLRQRDQDLLSEYIALQFLRTKERRIALKDLFTGIHNFLGRTYSAADIEKHFSDQIPLDLSESGLATLQSQMLLSTETRKECAQILRSHIWLFIKCDSNSQFYSSDNPIAIQNHRTHSWRSMRGISSPGVEIVLPLSPDYLLSLCERSHFLDYQYRDRTACDSGPANVVFYNHLQIKSATRYLFAKSDDFEFARTVCKEEPQWTKQDWKRIENSHDNPDALRERLMRARKGGKAPN